jgi:hypothetical protein
MTKNDGCAFGMVNRTMIDGIKSDVTSIKEGIESIREEQKVLFNHQSNRLPMWATVIITILSSLCTGIIIWGLSK